MLKFIRKNIVLILSLVYILSPIDFIPEALVGPLGLLDDFVVASSLLVVALIRHDWKREQPSIERDNDNSKKN